MLCVKCGYDNQLETFYCQNCGKRLPESSMYNVMSTPNTIDTRLKSIKKLCEDVQNEVISIEVYSEQIIEIYNSITNDSLEIREVAQEDDYEGYSPEETEIGYLGLELWLEGLEELYAYIDILDTDFIKSGLKKIVEGNDCINKAIYYNELKRDTEGTQGKI